jgi:hypothetical protein
MIFIRASTKEFTNSPQKYGEHGGGDDAPGRAERDLVGGLMLPEWGRGQGHHDRRHERGEASPAKPAQITLRARA